MSTVGTSPDEEALAVFSFREEALLFLSGQGLAEGWPVTEVGADELISVLLDSCPARIALDSLPGVLGGKMVGLLSMEQERFLGDLLRKRWPRRSPFTLRPRVRRVGGFSGAAAIICGRLTSAQDGQRVACNLPG